MDTWKRLEKEMPTRKKKESKKPIVLLLQLHSLLVSNCRDFAIIILSECMSGGRVVSCGVPALFYYSWSCPSSCCCCCCFVVIGLPFPCCCFYARMDGWLMVGWMDGIASGSNSGGSGGARSCSSRRRYFSVQCCKHTGRRRRR